MNLQHHEQRFIESLEKEFDTEITEVDKSMLIRIWRRHGGNVKSFQVGKIDDPTEDPDLCSIRNIYIQNGRFHTVRTGLDRVDYEKPFLVIVRTRHETEVGIPISNVYLF